MRKITGLTMTWAGLFWRMACIWGCCRHVTYPAYLLQHPILSLPPNSIRMWICTLMAWLKPQKLQLTKCLLPFSTTLKKNANCHQKLRMQHRSGSSNGGKSINACSSWERKCLRNTIFMKMMPRMTIWIGPTHFLSYATYCN